METLDSNITRGYVETMKDNDTIVFQRYGIVLSKYGEQYYLFDRSASQGQQDHVERYFANDIDINKVAEYPNKEFVDNILYDYYRNTTEFVVEDNGFRIKVYDKITQSEKRILKLMQKRAASNALTIKVYRVDKQTILRIVKDYDFCIEEINHKRFDAAKMKREAEDSFKKSLLYCDKVRCNLEPYDDSLLTNPDRGHWDLYERPQNNYFCFVPRDPKNDVNDRVVGIDFGTKSTVVYYLTENSEIMPIPIGGVEFGKKERYENPTILHFLALEKFIKDYRFAMGRPNTKWEDLTVAHTAQTDYEGADSKDYCSYLSHLKQWAMGTESLRLRAQKEKVLRELPAFSDLKGSDWDPIEFYAYFIGLHINNMRNTKGIYFDYYLSYAIKCPESVREGIRKSFERGLKKSLPSSLLADTETMKNFRVQSYVPEPTAYAVCALQEYKIEKNTFYSVFDFGGGTTDFDFGEWRKCESGGDYNYEIESYGGDGIATCGGENILEDLACEVFRQNIDYLIEQGEKEDNNGNKVMSGKYFPFKLGPTSSTFVGAEIYCTISEYGDRNMLALVKELRPYWENSKTKLEGEDKDGSIDLSMPLYDNLGKQIGGLKLNVTKSFIKEFICGKIIFAVENFFAAMKVKFAKCSNAKIKVFLAGNSSKSIYVRSIFDELKETTSVNAEIYPPLGTDDAARKIKETNPQYQDNAERPTAKTGVAFGLISCREGGEVKIVKKDFSKKRSSEFSYYIGKNKEGKFAILKDNPDLKQWYKFRNADVSKFDVFYTDKPKCLDGDMPITEAKRASGTILKGEKNFVFVRVKDSHILDYVVSDSVANIKEANVKQIRLG